MNAAASDRGAGDSASKRSPAALPLAVLAVGALSIVLLVLSVQLQRRTVRQNIALAEAVGQLQADVAICHLWLEELVSGDAVDPAEIDRRIERSQRLLDVMLGEAPPAEGSALRALPPDAWALRIEVTGLQDAFVEFRQISEDRLLGFERGLAVGIGSAFDVEYDRVFGHLLEHAEGFEHALDQRRAVIQRRDTQRLLLLALAWAGGLALAAAGLWTRELRRRRAEHQLAASREHLERSHTLEALGRLARGLAHDLNNYLAAIRAQSELVASRTGDDETRGRMRTVIGTVERASGLLERLLTFGRHGPERVGPVDLNRRLRDQRDLLEATAGDDVRLVLALQPDVPPVRIDAGRFDQLVLNLVVNARDAMPRGGELTLETSADGADEVTLRVADTGVGIPPEHLETIFEPFWSAKGGSHRGLGLSIVYGVVRRADGRIDVRSLPGEGTTFEITFPGRDLPVEASVSEQDPEALATGGATGELNHRTEARDADAMVGRLLFVDDHEEYREATAALLETLGFEVVTAASAREGLEHARTDADLELALVDVLMPDLDGVELTRRLRALRPEMPVLLLSGDAEAATRRYGGVEGVEVLGKEASTRALVDAVRLHLAAPSSSAPSSAPSSSVHVRSTTLRP